jgi:DNA-binding transcriptional LysR family regulator
VALGRKHIAPLVPAYKQLCSEVRIELILSDRIIDLEEEGFDLAVRSWRPKDSSLMARRLGSLHRVVCAAPSYLERYGIPRTPADLAGHRCLILDTGGRSEDIWYFESEKGLENIKVSGDLSSNSTEVIAEWALAGMGLAMKSTWDVENEIRDGHLVVVLSEYMIQDHGLYVLYPNRQYLPARVRTFIDFMAKQLGRKGSSFGLDQGSSPKILSKQPEVSLSAAPKWSDN